MSHFVIGVDVGGTNIKLGMVNLAGRVIARSSFTTKTYSSSKNRFINALVINIQDFLSLNDINRKNVIGVGIGLPGLIDLKLGIVNALPNIPGWNDTPLKTWLEKKRGHHKKTFFL